MPDKKKGRPEFKKIEGQPGLFAFVNLEMNPQVTNLVIREATEVSTAASKMTRQERAEEKPDSG
jgi:hypothetical protein